jgi:uncharacterized membrane protein
MGIGMAVARTVVGKIMTGLVVALIVLYILPRYPLDFWQLWLVVSIIGIAIGLTLWILMPDRDKVTIRSHPSK